MAGSGGWKNAGQGWEGIKDRLRLSGWSRARRVVLLRRRIKEQLVHNHWDDITGQLRLSFAEIESGEVYEYAALVTSLEAELLTLGQLYRATMDGLQSEVSPSLTPRPGLYVKRTSRLPTRTPPDTVHW